MPQRNGHSETLEKALLLHRQGRLPEAEQLYRNILNVDSKHFDTLYHLALIRAEQSKVEDAVELFQRALAQQPSSFDAHVNLAIAFEMLGRFEEAIIHCNNAARIRPRSAEAHFTLGNALKALDRPEEAIAAYQKALAINPNYAEAYYNLANTFATLGWAEHSVAAYNKAIAIAPRYANALNNRGAALQALERYEEALASYDRALSVKSDHVEPMNNRGVTLSRLRRYAEALVSFDRALILKPGYAEGWHNRADTLRALGCYAEALAAYRKALAILPDHVDALVGAGNVHIILKQYEEALANFEKALLLNPDHPHANTGWARAAAACNEWGKTATVSGQLVSLVEEGNFLDPFTLFGYCGDPYLQFRCAQKTLDDLVPDPPPRLWNGHLWTHDKIRVAYLSADFHQHPTALLTAELFELHDRSRFEVLGFSFGPNDGSVIRTRLTRAFDQFHDVAAKSDQEVARFLNDLQVDIAVDLNGYTRGARPAILAHRPAPIQVNYLVFSGTMAADFIDYIIADEIVLPLDHAPFYSEKIVQLPGCYQVNDRRRAIAAHVPTREEAGLPAQGFVFCCFNNSHKITAPVFDIWMRLLHEVEGSVLWLLRDNVTAEKNLRMEAVARGIDPSRLVFAPRLKVEDHLARHRLADLFLDTVPFNAHTTASDALWAGLPLLTCRGESFPGRVAASLLNGVGLPELVTNSLEEYELVALQLATDRALLRRHHNFLEQNRQICSLFDTDRFCRHIEGAYIKMWEFWQRGEGPRNFTVALQESTAA